jgi:hypothetical protein
MRSDVAFWAQAVAVPLPPFQPASEGSHAMSPAAAIRTPPADGVVTVTARERSERFPDSSTASTV